MDSPKEDNTEILDKDEFISPRRQRRYRFLLRFVLRIIIPIIMALAITVLWRLVAPTQNNWCLFPIRQGNLVCQNYGFWLLGRCYGDIRVYRTIRSAADHLRSVYPAAGIAYMDVSGRRPGRMWPHRSHAQGLDIDLMYLGRKSNGDLYPSRTMIFSVGYLKNYDRHGWCGGLQFDAGANWTLLEGLYLNQDRRIEAIFVEPYIKKWLIDEGKRRKAKPAIIEWASGRLRFAGDEAAKHDDHLHVRFHI